MRMPPFATSALLALLLAGRAAGDAPHPLGSFTETTRRPVFHPPIALAVGDLDGDGHIDVMVANDDSSMTTLLGDGAGAFKSVSSGLFAWDLVALALGDIDGDGRLDFVVSAPSAGDVIAVQGTGNGFSVLSTMHAPWSPGAIALGDLDGDRRPEIVVADQFFQAIVVGRLGQAGAFEFVSQTSGFPDTRAIAFGDIDRDGIADLAVADGSGHVGSVLFGDGHGELGARQDGAVTGQPVAVAVGDMDRDGHDDLVLATRAPGAVAVLLGAADRSLRPAGEAAAANDPSGIALGDFDADGILDVAVTDRTLSEIRILHGTGRGTFNGSESIATGHGPSAIAVADMNGDGYADLVVANHDEQTVQVFVNTAHPAAPLLLAPPMPNPSSAASTLSIVLATGGHVQVDILDLNGRLVRRLLDRDLPAGAHSVQWDARTDKGSTARSGLYFVHVQAGGNEATTRLVLTR